jgi:heat shock protein HslJ
VLLVSLALASAAGWATLLAGGRTDAAGRMGIVFGAAVFALVSIGWGRGRRGWLWGLAGAALLDGVLLAHFSTRPAQTGPAGAALRAGVAGADWTLADLNGRPAPLGEAGRRATIDFEATADRVSGFAGCNRYAAGYAISGDSLRFDGAVLTKMNCMDGMELEQAVMAALAATRTFQLNGAELTLIGAVGPVARFTKPAPIR